MKALGNILSPALGRSEVLREARARRTLREWSWVVGETLGSRSCPDRYERGVVFVAVQGSAWAQELRLAKPQILGRLRARAGDASLFLDLRFGVRPLRPLPTETTEPEPAPPPSEETRSIREIAEARLNSWNADRD